MGITFFTLHPTKMDDKFSVYMILSIFLLWNTIIPKPLIFGSVPTNFHLDHILDLNASVTEKSHLNNFLACSIECLIENNCVGILFNENAETSAKCKALITGQNPIHSSEVNGYHTYIKGCKGVPMLSEWTSSCPALYLPFDGDHGGQVIGQSPESLQYIPGGKLGHMLYHPADGTSSTFAYLRLGPYTAPSFCFTYPKDCPEGVTYAMWINLLGDTGVGPQGFFTTYNQIIEQGVVSLWLPEAGILFAVAYDYYADSVYPVSEFMANYGFNVWVHYVFVYKYDGPGTEIDIYMDGVVQSCVKDSNGPSSRPNSNTGILEIGTTFLGMQGLEANMKMDEFLVWETVLSADDIQRLSQAYD